MAGMDYWDRLKEMQILSQERRRERYMCILMFKASMGHTHGYRMEFQHSDRRGWLAVPKAPAAVRRARESSLAHKGAILFNLLPIGLRNMSTEHHDRFKQNLDIWLEGVPDQPTIPGRQRAAPTNSIMDQVTNIGH